MAPKIPVATGAVLLLVGTVAKLVIRIAPAAIGIVVFVYAARASAGSILIWDQTPGATGGTPTGLYSNNSSAINFADPVSFASNMLLTGVDVYTGYVLSDGVISDFGTPGTPVVISIRTGSNTGPLTQISSVIDAQDTSGAPPGSIPGASGGGLPGNQSYYVRAHSDLPTTFELMAGVTYWIGMSGNALELGQGFMTVGPGAPAGAQTSQYDVTSLEFTGLNPDQISMLRLWGESAPSPVPLPATGWLLLTGLGGLAVLARRSMGAG